MEWNADNFGRFKQVERWQKSNQLRKNSSQIYGTLCRTSYSETSLSTNDSKFREINIAECKNRMGQIKR